MLLNYTGDCCEPFAILLEIKVDFKIMGPYIPACQKAQSFCQSGGLSLVCLTREDRLEESPDSKEQDAG
jgi:hypothetical protein